MATIVIRGPDGAEQEHDVTEQLTIGRAEGNDLVLAEGGVSRNHARFFVDGAELHVEDVGSSNGTWVDGERIEGPVALTSASQVVIGDYEVALKVGSKPVAKAKSAAPSRAPTGVRTPALKGDRPRSTRVVAAVKPSAGAGLAKRPAASRAAGPQLRGLNGAITGKVFPLSGVMVVGRVAGNDLTVDDDSVSRKHAEVEVRGREVVVRDLGSANGTTVNGVPITDETPLASGAIVQFGVVELMFETSASSGAAKASAPVRRAPPERPARGGGDGPRRPRNFDDEPSRSLDDAPPPMDPQRKRVLLIAASVGTLLFVAVLAKAFTAPPDPIDHGGKPVGPARNNGKRPVSDDPAQQIDDLLTECRTYSSADVTKPDWKRAAAACEKILDLEPIHAEANTMLKRIQVEKACEENLEKGKELAITGQVEASIDAFARVGAKQGECPVFALRALGAAKDPVTEVKKLAGRECKDYALNAKWDNAYKRCELYMRLACQMMDDKDLYAPALTKLRLDGPVGKGDWRPSDPLYINFLKARERVKPGEPQWRCPVIPAFRPPPPPEDLSKPAKDDFAKRFKDPDMGQALIMYFDGRPDALVPLQKIRENMSKASEHDEARGLLDDISMAQNLLANGLTEITNEKPEKAEAPFRKALEVDEKLVLGERRLKMDEEARRKELDRRASFVRRTITDTMSTTCYNRGKTSADRKDFRQACKMWKLGVSFSRANIDLLKALTNVCTRRAEEAIGRAQGCEQLKQVLDFAVDGDGFKKQAEDRMLEEGCTTE